MSKLLNQALASITPLPDECRKTLAKVHSFLKTLNSELKKRRLSAKAVLGGSYAKDTWLSGDYDVDIFVKFAKKYKNQNLSDLLEKALSSPVRIHGSRDYFWVRDGIKYEIVPVLDIKYPKDAQNVTDFSPLHVAWVNSKGKKFKDNIRLVKKFCKASKCYGAESYIRGFSGHVVDILTIHYKGFTNLLKAASQWKLTKSKPKVVIDCNKIYKGRALLVLNKSKIEGPLVVIDPVQPDRNAAAALTQENFDRFVSAAESFLKKPSLDFFVEKEIDFKTLAKKGNFFVVNVKTVDEKEDVAGTKFVRAFEFVRRNLEGFVVKDSGWVWDKKSRGVWWFVLKHEQLSPVIDWMGPPLKIKNAVQKFKSIYKKTFVKKGRVYAKIKRKERTPKQVLSRVLNDNFVKSRVVSARV